MHHKYHTEGLILGSRNYGEAGKCYYIFTRDLGMIFASAAGVRKLSSKLRFVLQDYAYVKVDFVRGKEFWRLTSASKTNKFESLVKDMDKFAVYSNVLHLLKRLLTGEEVNKELFTNLLDGLNILENSNSKDELRNIEIILVLRILDSLGYIGGHEIFENLVKSPFEKELIFEVAKNRTKVISEINRALRDTQL